MDWRGESMASLLHTLFTQEASLTEAVPEMMGNVAVILM